MALPPGFLDDLRGRISLAQVVGRKLSWDPRKSNPAKGDYWAPCPFHQEKTPSFHVDDRKGFYYCFGCHAKGDAVDFVRQTESLGFMEAVEVLAREAGVAMPARDPAAAARAAAAQGLAEAMEAAVRFFRAQLGAARAAEVRAYLDRRGLAPATRERFEIGFAPDERTALLDHLAGKGFPRERLVEAGLVKLHDGGGASDRFRNRIMFPIRDPRGRAIGFGARAVRKGQEPKYLNSPETPLFDKGRTLFNAGPARAAAAKAGTAIVVEGYMDAIALAQAGLEHAVAPLGTAVTETQLEALWKLSPEPVVAFDGDASGQEAAWRLLELALPSLGPERALRFARLPAGQDPDDVLRDGGRPAMEALLAASRPAVDLIWTRETEGQVLDSPERRAALDARLKAHLARIRDAGLRGRYAAEFRGRTLALAPARPDRARPGARSSPPPAAPTAITRASLLARPSAGPQAEARVRESAILAGCLHHPAVARRLEDRLERMAFACGDLRQVRDALLSALADSLDDGGVVAAVTARLGRDPLPDLAALGQVRATRHLGPGADPAQAEVVVVEQLERHAATAGLDAEARDAAAGLSADTADSIAWRLREAAEAARSAASRPLAEGAAVEAEAEATLAARLRALIDTESWKKPRRR